MVRIRRRAGSTAAILAVDPHAVRVKRQRVILQLEAPVASDLLLAALDLGIEEFLDPSALKAYQMIVVLALVELEHRLAGLEVVALEQSGLFELGEHAIHGGQPDVLVLGKQFTIDVFGAHVALLAVLENLEDLQARQGGLQAHALQLVGRGHLPSAPGAGTGQRMISAFHQLPAATGSMNTDTASIENDDSRDRRRACLPRAALVCLAAGAILGALGCASKDTSRSGLLEPYRTDLPQGNYLTREQVDQVHAGMSRDQVRFILGTPLLSDVFHTDRWDYVFMFKHPSGQTERRRVTVHFDKDTVASIDADPLPLREDASDPALPGYQAGAAGPAPEPGAAASTRTQIESGRSRVEGSPDR